MSDGSAGISAKDACVGDALAELNGELAPVAISLVNGEYALWFGSGISLGRAPSVGGLIEAAIEHLRSKSTPNDNSDPFGIAIRKVFRLAEYNDDDFAQFDLATPVASWPQKDQLIDRLWNKYSKMLDIRVSGQADDYLLWDAVDVRQRYGVLEDPDAEHLCVAILILEGAVKEIASANWDGLIELAVEQLSSTGRAGILQVIVDPSNVRDAKAQAKLLKFHGCAVLCVTDPNNFRKFLVATKTQITDWPNTPHLAALRSEVQQVATSSKTLMIGLSLQDASLQDIFSKARQALPWVWPVSPPPHIFCEDELGEHQQDMLRVVYGTSYGSNEDDILDGALYRAWGKASLAALVVKTISIKLDALMRIGTIKKLATGELDGLTDGLATLASVLAKHAPKDPSKMADFIREFVRIWSRAMRIYRSGQIPKSPVQYESLSPLPVSQMVGDPNVATENKSALAATLALMGRRVASGAISISGPADDSIESGALTAKGEWGGTKPTQIYFAESVQTVLSLTAEGALDGENIIVIHCDDAWKHVAPNSGRRSPSGDSRTDSNKVRHIIMSELISGCATLADLDVRFAEEATI